MPDDPSKSVSPNDPTPDPESAMPAPLSPAAPEPLIGTKIGSCTLKRVIGVGGMGTVYEVMQDQPRRRAALKMMNRGITSKSALRRFEFESQTLARLRHSGIAQVYEAGTHVDGGEDVPYFVMEYISSAKPLTQYAQDKKLSTKGKLDLFAKVCEAVQHGHLKGIVHRDLKPGNILVDSTGQPKVIDFGVARSTDSDLAVTTLQTEVGQLVGTLQYMSPEQCEADPSDIDARSDVYALGVVLYELLTGALPHDLQRVAIHEAVRIVREEEPTRLSAIDHHLRGDIETVAMKALEKDRDRRYQSATALEQDIQHCLEDEPIAARPPGAIDYLRRFARKHTAAAVALAAVFVVLVGAVISISIFAYETSRQRELADEQRIRAETQEANATAVKNFTTEMLASVNPDVSGIAHKQQMQQVLVQAADSLHDQFESQPLVEAEIRLAIGTTYGGMGMYEESEEHLAEALDIYLDILGREHPDTIRASSKMGAILLRLGRYKEAERYLLEALDLSRRVLGDDDPLTLNTIDIMGSLRYSQGQLANAETYYQEAIAGRERVLGEDDDQTLSSIGNMGNLRLAQHKYVEAEEYLRQALEGRRRTLGHDHPSTLWSLTSMGIVLQRQGNYDEAEVYIRESLEGNRRVLGGEHPSTLTSISSMGTVLYMQKKYDEAATYYREELDLKQRILGDEHPHTLTALDHMGALFFAQNNLEQAESHYRQALEGRRRVLGEDHLETLNAAHNLATTLFTLEKFQESERYDLFALEGYRRVFGEQGERTLETISGLSKLYEAWGKPEEAQKYREMLPATEDNP